MKTFELKLLYRDGKALTDQQLADAPRYVGSLVVESWTHAFAVAQFVRQARFLDMTLLDAMLVRMVDGGLTLYGYEMHPSADARLAYRHIQSWELAPVAVELV